MIHYRLIDLCRKSVIEVSLDANITTALFLMLLTPLCETLHVISEQQKH